MNNEQMVRKYGEFSAGAWLIASSEGSAAIVTSSLTPNEGAGELDEPRPNIQTLQSEDDQWPVPRVGDSAGTTGLACDRELVT